MVIEHFTKGKDGKFTLTLSLVSGCWTEQMKQQAQNYYTANLGDVISEIKFD